LCYCGVDPRIEPSSAQTQVMDLSSELQWKLNRKKREKNAELGLDQEGISHKLFNLSGKIRAVRFSSSS